MRGLSVQAKVSMYSCLQIVGGTVCVCVCVCWCVSVSLFLSLGVCVFVCYFDVTLAGRARGSLLEAEVHHRTHFCSAFSKAEIAMHFSLVPSTDEYSPGTSTTT